MASLAIVLLIALMAFGVPVAWSFALVLLYLVVVFDVNTSILLLQGFRALDSIILLALPLFILTGQLMNSGGIARRLVEFIDILVQGRRGGLGASMVLSSGVFGAISGTATAAVASIGTIMVSPLAERGYPRGYSSALLGISSLLGILIPPSIVLILFGVVTRQSISALFAATLLPGALLIIGLIAFNWFCAGRWFHEKPAVQDQEVGQRSRLRVCLAAVPALTMPVIILGGIYGGVFTPTEAAAVAAILSIVVGFFIYRELTLRKLRDSLYEASISTGTIILILLFSFMIGRVLVAQRLPQELTEAITLVIENPILILLLVNLILVIAGALMDDISVTVVIAPLFMPLMQSVDVVPIHFGAIVACSAVLGSNSPPVAPILYMACRTGQVSIHRAIVPALYMMGLVAFPVMLATTFIPELSLALPRMFGLYHG